MLWLAEKCPGRAGFHNPAPVHDGDTVCHLGGHGQVVGNKQHGHAGLAL